MTKESQLRLDISWPLWIVGLTMILAPLADFLAGLGSPSPGAVPWRFGALGLLSTALLLPTLGLTLVLVAMVLRMQHRALKVLAIIAGLSAVTVIALIVVFGLDAIQVRGQVRQDVKRNFDLATLKALLAFVLQGLTFATVSWQGFRLSSTVKGSYQKDANPKLGGRLVVGK